MQMKLPFSTSKQGISPYTMFSLYLRKNVVCYDNDIFSQLWFWRDQKCDIENTTNFEHQKIQLSKFGSEIGISNPFKEIYFGVLLGMDSEMKTHVLTSYKLLDFLGDLGGFKEALNIVFSFIGTYFSA
jgi:hypothetical protein